MTKRELYLTDDDTGAIINRWPVSHLTGTHILALERSILASLGEGVSLRDSLLDERRA